MPRPQSLRDPEDRQSCANELERDSGEELTLQDARFSHSGADAAEQVVSASVYDSEQFGIDLDLDALRAAPGPVESERVC